MNEHDIERMMQCVMCKSDPEKCGCSEKDEDENGMCKKYKEEDWKKWKNVNRM